MANVYGEDFPRAILEQTIGKAAGRGANVEREFVRRMRCQNDSERPPI